MSASGSHAQPGGGGLPSAEELRDFKWMAPEAPRPRSSRLTETPASSYASERAERVNATIVIVLTLACTALSLFDLYLLASGL